MSVTSYDVSNNVLNEVRYEYGPNQKLARLYQSHSGEVNIFTTPCVQYGYGSVANKLRLETMTYPNGKMLAYHYDGFGNISAIAENNEPIVSYQYSGMSAVKTTYNKPGLALDYTVSTARDRFGRIIDHAWKKGSTNIVRIQHGYDRVGNRTNRADTLHSTNSETYSYDGVNQIKSLNRTGFSETWNYDLTGNWLQYSRSGVATENRTHNKANEIQSTCIHDRNGNMTLMPGLKGKYDAWNRLVEVRNASNTLLAAYAYNGLNQRIRKTVGSTVTTSFYNADWQELDSVTNSTVTSYIWGLRYIDDLIYRQRGTEKLYSLADPNWNIVATTNATGTVQERMRYDAFGKVTWLNATFGTKTSSGFAWNRTFTGQVLDTETSLMLYRNRYYHIGLGRFVQRDPIGYDAGDESLYRYVFNLPNIETDTHGLTIRDIGDGNPLPACKPCKTKKVQSRNPDGTLKPFEVNGCTGVPDRPGNRGYDFGPACNTHDRCYETCGTSRLGCDVSFYNDMLAICNNVRNPVLKRSCKADAYMYYAAVYWIGWIAFNNYQDKWCDEVCED